jgi:hypothetical protein
MDEQTVETWLKNTHPFNRAKVEYEGKKISLEEYFLTRDDVNITEDTVEDLKKDFEDLGLDKLKFSRTSDSEKWRKFLYGESGVKNTLVPAPTYCDTVQFKRDIELIIRFPQSGKTGLIMRDLITFHKKYENTDIISVGIVVSDNSLLLNHQTYVRAESTDIIKGLKISSKSRSKGENYNKSTTDDVFHYLKSRIKNTLFYCGHSSRTRVDGDIVKFLDMIGDFARNYCVAIFIDEADKVLSKKLYNTAVNEWLLKKTFSGRLLVEQLKLITATPCDISPKWTEVKNWVGKYLPESKIPIQYVDALHGENYHILSDSNYIKHEMPEEEEESDEEDEEDEEEESDVSSKRVRKYVRSFLARKLPINGDVWLIPGAFNARSHEEIRKICESDNPETGEPYFTDILIINSVQKEMRELEISQKYYDKKNKWIPKPLKNFYSEGKELKEWLKEYWTGKDPTTRRLAITGNRCLGRGITFSTEKCNISLGLFGPYCSTQISEKYQLLNRLAGYTRNANNKPDLVCSTEDFLSMQKYEALLRQLLELGQNPDENIRELNEQKVKCIVNKIKNDFDPNYDADSWEHEWKEFTDKNTAEQWLGSSMKDPNNSNDQDKQEFYESSFDKGLEILKYDVVVDAMKDIDNGLRRKTMNLPGANIKLNQCRRRTYLVYKNLEDSNSLVYICRKLTKVR